MNNEEWKEVIVDNENTNYEVSNLGNVKNKTTNKILKPSVKSGYFNLSLSLNNKFRKTLRVHRLVATAFIPNSENKYTVNHKDHNRLNNNVENLEWATTIEQNQHRRKCSKEIQELVSSRAVWRVDAITNEKLQYFKTIKFASQWIFDNNLTSVKEFNEGNNIKTKICAVARNNRKTTFGYKWVYDTTDVNIYENEIWKEIPPEIIDDVKGYTVSNYGRIKSHKGRITNGYNHESGYLWVSIFPKQYLLHRIVAKVFIPNTENKEQVNHKDGNKSNCNLENLEWMTCSENSQHCHDTGLHKKNKLA